MSILTERVTSEIVGPLKDDAYPCLHRCRSLEEHRTRPQGGGFLHRQAICITAAAAYLSTNPLPSLAPGTGSEIGPLRSSNSRIDHRTAPPGASSLPTTRTSAWGLFIASPSTADLDRSPEYALLDSMELVSSIKVSRCLRYICAHSRK